MCQGSPPACNKVLWEEEAVVGGAGAGKRKCLAGSGPEIS